MNSDIFYENDDWIKMNIQLSTYSLMKCSPNLAGTGNCHDCNKWIWNQTSSFTSMVCSIRDFKTNALLAYMNDFSNNSDAISPFVKGKIGFTTDQANSLEVDWVRVMKTKSISPRTTVGSCESNKIKWYSNAEIEAVDRGVANFVVTDFNNATSSKSYSFNITDIPQGLYSVTLIMGDNDSAHDNMTVEAFVDGSSIGEVVKRLNTSSGYFKKRMFLLDESNDFDLTLKFSDKDSDTDLNDTGWVVNAIEIERGDKSVKIKEAT
jgi:hypothetical protein